MKTILITHVSPHGSTAEIAGHLKQAFEAEGHRAQIAGVNDALQPSDYSAVVVLAPINGMNWLPPARAFVQKHAVSLRERPLALVAVSYLFFEGRVGLRKAILKNLETIRSPFPHASLQVFGGRLPCPLPAPARWLFGVASGRPMDIVSPKAVREWAGEWVKVVQPAPG